ncbi:MAG: hypothetical protein ACOX1N_05835 [Candidatus Methanomethylophilaceae archaeon]
MFGAKVNHRSLNDVSLGRAMDTIFGGDLELMYYNIASRAKAQYGIVSKYYHIDGSNITIVRDPNREYEICDLDAIANGEKLRFIAYRESDTEHSLNFYRKKVGKDVNERLTKIAKKTFVCEKDAMLEVKRHQRNPCEKDGRGTGYQSNRDVPSTFRRDVRGRSRRNCRRRCYAHLSTTVED